MKFNVAILSAFLINTSYVMSNPVESNVDSISNLNKRDFGLSNILDIIFGPFNSCNNDGWEQIDKWPCCKFKCDNIKSAECRTICRNYKTEHPACGNNYRL
ncbi:hypothetical protein PIROE2DRAFT_1922 [Piromyces sp. E2]|nr:hypothetical protein PIROE2DRAFT_1922 [Piromyces sp. E2]|eukprot:OUM69984.1 hypothetical protein PIROE2DRAFT_1922 [Piromyces sp. E2]